MEGALLKAFMSVFRVNADVYLRFTALYQNLHRRILCTVIFTGNIAIYCLTVTLLFNPRLFNMNQIYSIMKISTNLLRFLVLFVISMGAARVSAQSCPDNLVGYWKMDETSGITLNEEISGNDAIRNVVTGPVAGIIDNSQRFTFTTNYPTNNTYLSYEYAELASSSAYNFGAGSSFTISYWCYFTVQDYDYGFQDHIFISKGDWYGGGAGTGGMFGSGVNGAGYINFLLRDENGVGVDLDLESKVNYK